MAEAAVSPEAAEGPQAPAATEPPPEAAEGPQAPASAPEAPEAEAHLRSEEAKRYRTRLREAEAQVAERDGVIAALRSRLDDVDRAEVERHAEARGMVKADDLWTVAALADLRGEDGTLDEAKVTARVDEVLRDRPHWRRPSVDLGAGPRGGHGPREPGLSDLLKARRR